MPKLEASNMGAVTIRNLNDATHAALKLRAANNNRSTEAEIRLILNDAVKDDVPEVGMGTLLNQIAREHGMTDEEVDAILATRDRRELVPIVFE
jgi:antitoxin FitA